VFHLYFTKLLPSGKDLAKLHKEHLLPGFDDRVEEEQAIEILTGEITQVSFEL